MIEPLTAFDQQQRLGQRDGEGSNRLPRRRPSSSAPQRRSDRSQQSQHTVVVKRDGENQAYAGAFLGKQDVGLDKADTLGKRCTP